MDALQSHQRFLDLISVQFGTEEEFFRRVQLSFKTEEEQLKATHIFTILDSPEQLRDWFYVYFGLYMPYGNVSQTRDREFIEYSSPVHAMWEVYKAIRDNTGEDTPAFTLLSSRDSYKTLSASMLEVLLLLHFRTTISHCAAQLSQSQNAVGYCSGFKNKVMPYLEFWGWKQVSDSKNKIEFVTDKQEKPYINIVTLTMSGANGPHTQLLFVDEVDLCDPKAYQQAQLIPGTYQGQFPLKVRLSTRKFAFGMMEKEVQASASKDERVLIWNILDVTEYCPDSRCKPKEPWITRYIPLSLPLKQLTEKEYIELEESQKTDFVRIECMAGCGSCPVLSICKMKLRNKKPEDVKNLWKPIGAVRNAIRGCDVDVAEAELLCHRPSSSGLIYKRFSSELNTISVQEAYLSFTSGVGGNTNDFDMLRRQLIELDIPVYGGVDWAQSGESAFTIVAELPNGEFWLLDVFGAKDLEPDDLVRLGLGFQNKYNVKKWFVDQAYPAYIKLFKKKGMICPKFTKDVPKGIGNLRTAILDAMDVRRFKIIKTKETQRLIDAFGTYHWKLDQQGNATEEPDHTEESDIMDSLRYIFQVAYKPSNKSGVLISAAKEQQHEIDYYKNKTVFEPGPTNLLDIIQQKTAGQHKIIKGKGLIFSP
jgi:hypothetical protein